MAFHRSLSDNKSLQVSRTLLSILAVLNNTVVWMVSTCPPTSKSSSAFNHPLVKAPISISTVVTFMFHRFFLIPKQGRQQIANFLLFFFFFLLLIIIRSGLLVEIRWSVCMLKSHNSLWVSFSRTAADVCIFRLFVWSNLNFLHISQWIALPTYYYYYYYYYYFTVWEFSHKR